ncbi:MAG: hypothetical protein EOM62_17875 [Bacteroidia bacterium]|nr:hypothetical protein [Bacteroidia bacterium]
MKAHIGGEMKKHLFPLFEIDRTYKSGVSLVETIIALFILSIAILAVAAVPIMSMKMAFHANQHEVAVFLAVKELDKLEAEKNDIENAKAEVDDFPGVSVWSRRSGGKGEVLVEWQGVTGPTSFSLERSLSPESSKTRKE